MCACAQVWAHLACLQAQMAQHPRHFHYNFAQYMCDLCQAELRVQAAQVGARPGAAAQDRGPPGHRGKPTASCARGEVCPPFPCHLQKYPGVQTRLLLDLVTGQAGFLTVDLMDKRIDIVGICLCRRCRGAGLRSRR